LSFLELKQLRYYLCNIYYSIPESDILLHIILTQSDMDYDWKSGTEKGITLRDAGGL